MDWGKEGLLDGLEGEERDARKELLDQLDDAGVDLDTLREAVKEDRLALVPAEFELGSDRDLTESEVAQQADVPVEFLRQQWRALGLSQPDADTKMFGHDDVEAAKDLKIFIDAGLEAEGVEEVARIIGQGMQRIARAVASLAAESLLKPGDTERDLGLRFAMAARELAALLGKQFDYVFRKQLRESVRKEVVDRAQMVSGQLPGADTITGAFADLVDFTKMGENVAPDEVGRVAGRLERIAS